MFTKCLFSNRHPTAAFFHVFFKLSALIVYLFGGLVGENFLGLFVLLVFLITFDFWTVKNVTGRLLVGLRWWNYIDEDGQSQWIFENRLKRAQQQAQGGAADTEFVLFNNDSAPNNQQLDNNQSNVPNPKGYDRTLFWSATMLAPIFWFFFLFSAIFSFNFHWVVSLRNV